jgi:2-oxoglutarate ferredoxin oxidoreductase subunit beta
MSISPATSPLPRESDEQYGILRKSDSGNRKSEISAKASPARTSFQRLNCQRFRFQFSDFSFLFSAFQFSAFSFQLFEVMSDETKPNGASTVVAGVSPATIDAPREKLNKKAITADHPTWCPGCGDFAVLASFYKVLEKRNLDHEKIVTLAGIGCSSRFPYFVNGHGAHFIHGRAVPLASGISLARPDLHVFLFGGDGDGFSIGGNHLDHGARKNINMTYFIMDNFVYGLTKKQTSPTSPIGFKSKTDPTGAIDQPVNPMKKLIAGGATFIARTHATQVKHMMDMIERAMDHQGFSVIECLSECVEFFPDVFDPADPRKGGSFELIQEKKWDNTPEDELRHDVTDELAAYKLAQLPFPGVFGVFYQSDRPTKNALEKKWIESSREKTGNASDLQLLQKTFDRMK